AFRRATTGKPGPVYLDLPGDVLGQAVDEGKLRFPARNKPAPRPLGDPGAVKEAIWLLARAERPLVIGGSGAGGSDAALQCRPPRPVSAGGPPPRGPLSTPPRPPAAGPPRIRNSFF